MNKFTPGLRAMWVCACAVLAVAGCATPVATDQTNELSFDQAVNAATDGLVSQTQKLPAFLAKMEAKIGKRGVVTDPMLDAGTGQQTGVTKLLEQRVTERMTSNYTQFDILPFQSANLSKAQYLLTGTITRVQGGKTSNVFRINLALTDLKTGNVVAQSSARARDEGLDTNPTPYYRDSPILVKDQIVDGYIRTCETPPGKPADHAYFERVATATLINEATTAYNSDRYQDALGLYSNALSTPAGEQLRVLNGVYLTNWKLGKTAEAERAFGKVVAFGIANNTLGVKFLFNPGSTDFWSDPKVSGPYALWLRQIARQAAAAKVCVNVVGHTSKTGSEPANDRLSQSRAMYIKTRLESDAPELASRTKATGMGFRENIVGTGTDDARDALDRRVEFKISGC
jgi:outer membrane protein OmpA-like peptidoglycan-associated protein